MSAKDPTLPNRRPGEVGLYGLTGTSDSFERLAQQPAQGLAVFQRHDRLLPRGAARVAAAPRTPQLALDVERIDALHLALTGAQLFHRVPDVDLGRVRGHLE